MMHRREFLRRSALIAAGVVAADQIDLLEMLAPRRLFALGEIPKPWRDHLPPDVRARHEALDDYYAGISNPWNASLITLPIPSQMNFAALDGDYGLRVIS